MKQPMAACHLTAYGKAWETAQSGPAPSCTAPLIRSGYSGPPVCGTRAGRFDGHCGAVLHWCCDVTGPFPCGVEPGGPSCGFMVFGVEDIHVTEVYFKGKIYKHPGVDRIQII